MIDWTKAPLNANYHAFDANGEGFWYGRKPVRNVAVWWREPGSLVEQSGYTLPASTDWKTTLVKREG